MQLLEPGQRLGRAAGEDLVRLQQEAAVAVVGQLVVDGGRVARLDEVEDPAVAPGVPASVSWLRRARRFIAMHRCSCSAIAR
jgi:hypothetical protein